VKRGAFTAVVTILFAVAAAVGVFLFMQNVREDAKTPTDTVGVVVSTQDIPAASEMDPLIEAEVFTTKEIPVDDVVQGAITDVYQLRGQRTAYPILAGEQIVAARLAGELQAAGGQLGIPPGYQAASVTLEGQRVVAGALQQGDHVEIWGTFKGRDAAGDTTRVVIPDAEVLAVYGGTETGAEGRTVTLAVTPPDASLLIWSQEQGRVWLTLLPPNEFGIEVPPTTVRALR
jgi:Flp pilus assembly protein CpaB